jgi:hypothetical protein
MIDNETFNISPSLASEIEDAIMFGKPDELKLLLDKTDQDDLPAEVRQGLESLHYFRQHYGQTQVENETDKKKVTLMDSAWAMELLNKVRAKVEAVAKRA